MWFHMVPCFFILPCFYIQKSGCRNLKHLKTMVQLGKRYSNQSRSNAKNIYLWESQLLEVVEILIVAKRSIPHQLVEGKKGILFHTSPWSAFPWQNHVRDLLILFLEGSSFYWNHSMKSCPATVSSCLLLGSVGFISISRILTLCLEEGGLGCWNIPVEDGTSTCECYLLGNSEFPGVAVPPDP